MTALALGEFVPGQRLPPERELAATLGVSRTTVREAVSRLAATGVLDVRRGRNGGAYVTGGQLPDADERIRRTLTPGWAQLEGLFDFRALVEPLIARTAASRRSPGAAGEIAAALQAYRDAGTDREASGRADGALHRAIAEAAGNPYLVDLHDGSGTRSVSGSGRRRSVRRSGNGRSGSTRRWPRRSSRATRSARRRSRRSTSASPRSGCGRCTRGRPLRLPRGVPRRRGAPP